MNDVTAPPFIKGRLGGILLHKIKKPPLDLSAYLLDAPSMTKCLYNAARQLISHIIDCWCFNEKVNERC